MTSIVAVGTTSSIKVVAVRTSLVRAGIAANVLSHATPSGVNAQPVGRDETLRGATNRARAAAAAIPGCIGIGIENGIVHEDGRWIDLAAVVIVGADGRTSVAWSEAVAVPDVFVDEAASRGFEGGTVGAVIAERTGSTPDDPHAMLSAGRRTRSAILADALASALTAFTEEGGNAMKDFHRIEIGGITRDLPIREVAPGVRVALFNILGDWELAEAAGAALAAKLPEGIGALVMPDGKATALLHVMGRITGLPTFVARKEKKPYMADPVRTVTYRSITTDREQALCLGADDTAKLAGLKVAIVDDVVSTGGTIVAVRSLMTDVGAEAVAITALFTEGGGRAGVIALGDLPLF